MGSGPGIASMILGIIANILLWIVFPILLFMAVGARDVGLLVSGLLLALGALVLAVVGLIIGIVGVATDEKKVFSIIGLILCSIILFITASAFIGVGR